VSARQGRLHRQGWEAGRDAAAEVVGDLRAYGTPLAPTIRSLPYPGEAAK